MQMRADKTQSDIFRFPSAAICKWYDKRDLWNVDQIEKSRSKFRISLLVAHSPQTGNNTAKWKDNEKEIRLNKQDKNDIYLETFIQDYVAHTGLYKVT